jgi:hypothetical protein
VAARKAAKAALVFAKRRGAGMQNKSESAKPFIFKNCTGMSLTFTQHKHLEESKIIFNSLLVMLTEKQSGSHERPTGTTSTYLADGSYARFHISTRYDGSNPNHATVGSSGHATGVP